MLHFGEDLRNLSTTLSPFTPAELAMLHFALNVDLQMKDVEIAYMYGILLIYNCV